MEIALIISLIALAVALPGCIADTLTVIEKLRARRAQRLLKKSTKSGLDHVREPEQLPPFRYPIVPVGTKEQVVEYLSRIVPRRFARSTLAHEVGHVAFRGALKKI